MSPTEIERLQRRIHVGIPLSRAMGFRINSLGETSILVEAPLSPNVNVHETGFAGSLFGLGILTAWGLATHIVTQQGLVVSLVVARADIRYRAPVTSDIVCSCEVERGVAEGFVDRLATEESASLGTEVLIGDRSQAVLTATLHASRDRGTATSGDIGKGNARTS